MEDLIAYASAIGGSWLLGMTKKYTTMFDTAIGKVIKPLQPVVVAGLALLIPLIANAIGIVEVPTADALATAPTAALVAVVAREVLKKLKPTP